MDSAEGAIASGAIAVGRLASQPATAGSAAGSAAQRQTELVELRLDLVERGLAEVLAGHTCDAAQAIETLKWNQTELTRHVEAKPKAKRKPQSGNGN